MLDRTKLTAEQIEFIDHCNHAESTFEDGKFIHPPAVDGCAHCESAKLLPDIHAAWFGGNPVAHQILWSIQDGYGAAGYTPPQGHDWSGIRDSKPETIKAMHAAIHA